MPPPLRILHVTPYSEHAWAYGGIPRVVAGLTGAQARSGHHVTVATTDVFGQGSRLQPRGDATASRFRPWHTRTDAGVDCAVFPNVSNGLAYRWQFYQPLGLSRFLRRHARDFDIGHLHACHNILTASASRILHRAGVPFVVQPNGTAPRIEQRRLAKLLFDLLFAPHLLADADAVIAVSQSERRRLATHRLAAPRIHVVPNPLAAAPPVGPDDRAAFRRRVGLTEAPVVLFLGALSPRKHPVAVAEAFAGLGHPAAHLVFAGNDRGAEPGTRRAAHRLGIDGRTRFVGPLSGDDRFTALAGADVVVYASSDEVFGLVALEALQVGTPVIVGNDDGCGEVVAPLGGGVLVPPGDRQALTSALGEILRDVPRWRAAAAAGGTIATARYNPGDVWAGLEPVYRSVIAAAGRR